MIIHLNLGTKNLWYCVSCYFLFTLLLYFTSSVYSVYFLSVSVIKLHFFLFFFNAFILLYCYFFLSAALLIVLKNIFFPSKDSKQGPSIFNLPKIVSTNPRQRYVKHSSWQTFGFILPPLLVTNYICDKGILVSSLTEMTAALALEWASESMRNHSSGRAKSGCFSNSLSPALVGWWLHSIITEPKLVLRLIHGITTSHHFTCATLLDIGDLKACEIS